MATSEVSTPSATSLADVGLLILRVGVGATMIQAEIVYCARQEMSLTIEDVLARRIGLQLFSMQLSMEAAPVVATYLARELGWSSNEKDRAVREYVNNLEHKLRLLRTASA